MIIYNNIIIINLRSFGLNMYTKIMASTITMKRKFLSDNSSQWSRISKSTIGGLSSGSSQWSRISKSTVGDLSNNSDNWSIHEDKRRRLEVSGALEAIINTEGVSKNTLNKVNPLTGSDFVDFMKVYFPHIQRVQSIFSPEKNEDLPTGYGVKVIEGIKLYIPKIPMKPNKIYMTIVIIDELNLVVPLVFGLSIRPVWVILNGKYTVIKFERLMDELCTLMKLSLPYKSIKYSGGRRLKAERCRLSAINKSIIPYMDTLYMVYRLQYNGMRVEILNTLPFQKMKIQSPDAPNNSDNIVLEIAKLYKLIKF
jgi:hypothetical protein